jgi:hypothetical protein
LPRLALPPTTTQKLAVVLAFIAAALSLTAAVIVYVKRGEIATTPLFGGIFMLSLAIGGYFRLAKD